MVRSDSCPTNRRFKNQIEIPQELHPDPEVPVPTELSLTLLHINDHHSRLQPNTSADLRFNGQTTRVETGGFPRVVAKMRELSAGYPRLPRAQL